MNYSIFPKQNAISREIIKWEDYLYTLTPVEKVGELLFKREDYFAPLGYGFINGGKVRVGIHIFDKFVKDKFYGIIGGMSIHSPQHSFQAVVANHYGVESYHVIGATSPVNAIKHENIFIANSFGSKFRIQNVAYNPALQRAVKDITPTLKKVYPLEYAISLDHKKSPAKDIEEFHRVGAEQVKNIPETVENVILPMGSCNSLIGVLYGIAKYKPSSLKNIHLVGIGPEKYSFIKERCNIIERVSGIPCYPKESDLFSENEYPYKIHYHQSGVSYDKIIKKEYQGIEFHPRYEAKVFEYMEKNFPEILFSNKTLFWIVGSEPKLEKLNVKFTPNKELRLF